MSQEFLVFYCCRKITYFDNFDVKLSILIYILNILDNVTHEIQIESWKHFAPK